MNTIVIASIVYIVGLLVRLVYPYVLAYIQGDTESFDFRKVAGIVIGAAVGYIPTLMSGAYIETIGGLDQILTDFGPYVYYVLVFFMAFGTGSLGRDIQKTPGALKAYKENKS